MAVQITEIHCSSSQHESFLQFDKKHASWSPAEGLFAGEGVSGKKDEDEQSV